MMSPEYCGVCYGIRFKLSSGELYEVDWRDIEILQQRDPDGPTVPRPDPNVLLLTAEDCVRLWSQGKTRAPKSRSLAEIPFDKRTQLGFDFPILVVLWLSCWRLTRNRLDEPG